MQHIILYVFLTVGLVYMLHLGLYAVGANIYDIIEMAKSKPVKKREKLPLVSIIIAAYNEERSIYRCLETVWQSNYPRLEIVVIDDGSKDATYAIAKDFIASKSSYLSTNSALRRRPDGSLRRSWARRNVDEGRMMRLLTKQNGGKSSALNMALRQGVAGEYVMTLDADSLLDRNAVRNAVAYFANKNVAGVAANVRVVESMTILGLLQKIEHMIGYRSKKFYAMTSSELIVGGVASTYRRSVLEQVDFYDTDTQTEDLGLSMKVTSLGNKRYRLVYAPNVLAMTQGVQTFKALLKQRYRWKLGNLQNLIKYSSSFKTTNTKHTRMMTFYRIPMAYLSELMLLLEPFLLSYVVYLSFALQSPMLFVGSYMAITAYVLSTIWPDEHLTLKEKIHLSRYAPTMYFIFYIMDLIQLIAIFRCLANPKKLLLKVETDGRWVSPERQGFN